ncbi:MAG: hypothetical protein U1F66_07345 [bacterium]
MRRLKTAEERQQEQARYFEAMAKGYDPFNAFDKVEDHLGKAAAEEKNPFSKAGAEFKRLLGPMVPAVYRDSSGALDVAKIPAQNLPEFRQFLQDQAALNDGKSFRNPYEKLLKDPKFQGLFALLYQERDPKFNVLSLDAEEAEGLLKGFTQRLVAIDADKFVQSHLSSQVGREKIRGLLVSGEIGKGLRADLSKAVARVEEECLPFIENQVSMWNYFNLGLTEQAANHAAHYALNALSSLEDREANLVKLEREAKENPSRISTAGLKGAVGREIPAAEIEAMVKYREAKAKGHDPLSQAQTKLADLWLMAVDTRRFVGSEGGKIGYWNAYILKEAKSLIEASEGVVTDSQLSRFNVSLQAFLKDPIQGEEQGVLHFVKSQLEMKEGLQEVFAKQPNTAKRFYQDLLTLSDEWKYAQAMGERILPRESLEKVEDPELSKVLQDLHRMKSQLWYGYKQHKLISRGLSQAASLADRGDIQDIKQANKYIDETIAALESSDEEGRKEIAKKLYRNFQKGGCLYKGLEAAEMDGTEQVLGLVQTVGLMAALAMATRGVGVAARAGQISAELAEGATVAAEGAQGMARAGEASIALVETAQGSTKLIELGDKMLRGMGMGAYIATAENAAAKLSGEVRVGRETILSWLKDAVATGAAMALVSPLATSAGEAIHEHLLKDLAQRYVSGGAKGALHFLADTGLEAVEEVLDQYARQVLDGKTEALSLGEIEEITKICLAGGGSKVGILAEHLKGGGASQAIAHTKVLSEPSKVDSEKLTKTAQDHGTGRLPALGKLSAVVAGLSVLLDSKPVQAAMDAAGQAAGSGMGTLGAVLAGLGGLGAVGWWKDRFHGKGPSFAELHNRLGDLLDTKASAEELGQFWKIVADQMQEVGLPQGEWIAHELASSELGSSLGANHVGIDPKTVIRDREEISAAIRERFGIAVTLHFQKNGGVQAIIRTEGVHYGETWIKGVLEFFQSPWSHFVTEIRLDNVPQFEGAGIHWPEVNLSGLRTVQISSHPRHPFPPGIIKLFREANLSGLRELIVNENNGDDVLAPTILSAKNMQNLSSLTLIISNNIDQWMKAIHASRHFGKLKKLEVFDNASEMTAAGALSLANSPHLGSVEFLRLENIPPYEANVIAGSRHLRQLKELHISLHGGSDEPLLNLAKSKALIHLEKLVLNGDIFWGQMLEALSVNPDFPALTTLQIFSNSIDDRGLQALSRSRFAALRSLTLHRGRFTQEGMNSLAESPLGARLQMIESDAFRWFFSLRESFTYRREPGSRPALIKPLDWSRDPEENRKLPIYRVLEVGENGRVLTLQSDNNPEEIVSFKRQMPNAFQPGDRVRVFPLDEEGNVITNEAPPRQSHPRGGAGNTGALGLLLAGFGSGLATLLAASPAQAAVDAAGQAAGSGMGALGTVLAGLGVLGAVGWWKGDSIAKRPSVSELETQLGELLDAEASPEELRQFWAIAADQLQEMGLPQGEWIALALENEKRVKSGEFVPRMAFWNGAISEIERTLQDEISRRFGIPVRVIFNLDHGFQISPKYYPSHLARLDGDYWFERLAEIMEGGHLPFLTRIFTNEFSKFDGTGLDSAKLQAWTRLKGVRELHINRAPEEAPGLPKLLGSPHLTGLRVLSIMGSQVGEDVIQALAHSQALSGLKDLSLENIWGGPETFFPLAYSQNVGNLARLRILRSEYGDATVHGVAESEEFRNLKVLEVIDSQVGRLAAITLSRASHLSTLETLIINGGNIDDRGVEYLARSQYLVGLKSLVLMGHQISHRGAEALAQSRFLRKLVRLDLGLNLIGDAGLAALLQSDNFSNLHTLGLEQASISDHGMGALANARNMPRLQHLYLWRNHFGPDGRVALAGSLNGAKLIHVEWDDSVTFDVLRACLTFSLEPGRQPAIIQDVRRLEVPEHRALPSYRVIEVSHDALGVTLQNLQNPAETFAAYRDEPHQFQVGDEVKILALDPDGNIREFPKPEARSEKTEKVSSKNSGPGNGGALGLLLAGIGSGLATLLGADVAYAGVDPISQGVGGPSLAFLSFGVLMVLGFFHRIWSLVSGSEIPVSRGRALELDESLGYRGAAVSPNELLVRAVTTLRERGKPLSEADVASLKSVSRNLGPILRESKIEIDFTHCRNAIVDIHKALLLKSPRDVSPLGLADLVLAVARNYGAKDLGFLSHEDRRDFRLQVLRVLGRMVPESSIAEALIGQRGRVLAGVARFLMEVCDEDLFERQDSEFWQAVREIFASKEGEDYLTYLRHAEAIRRSGGNLKASQQSYIVYALSLLWSGLVVQAPGAFGLSHLAGLLLGLGAGVGAAFRHYQIAAQRERDQKLLDQEAQAFRAVRGAASPRLDLKDTSEKEYSPEEFQGIEEMRITEAEAEQEAEAEAMVSDPVAWGRKNFSGPGGAMGLLLAGLGGGLTTLLTPELAYAGVQAATEGVSGMGPGLLGGVFALLGIGISALRKRNQIREEKKQEVTLQGYRLRFLEEISAEAKPEQKVAVVRRVLEHSVQDGIDLADRMGLSPQEIMDAVISPGFGVKHPKVLRLIKDRVPAGKARTKEVEAFRRKMTNFLGEFDQRLEAMKAVLPQISNEIDAPMLFRIDDFYLQIFQDQRSRPQGKGIPQSLSETISGVAMALRYLEHLQEVSERRFYAGPVKRFFRAQGVEIPWDESTVTEEEIRGFCLNRWIDADWAVKRLSKDRVQAFAVLEKTERRLVEGVLKQELYKLAGTANLSIEWNSESGSYELQGPAIDENESPIFIAIQKWPFMTKTLMDNVYEKTAEKLRAHLFIQNLPNHPEAQHLVELLNLIRQPNLASIQGYLNSTKYLPRSSYMPAPKVEGKAGLRVFVDYSGKSWYAAKALLKTNPAIPDSNPKILASELLRRMLPEHTEAKVPETEPGVGQKPANTIFSDNIDHSVNGGGILEIKDDQLVLQSSRTLEDMLVTGLYSRYRQDTRKWEKLPIRVTQNSGKEGIETKITLKLLQGPGRLVLPSLLGGQPLPESLRGVLRDGGEIRLHPVEGGAGEVAVEISKEVSEISYLMAHSSVPPSISEISPGEFEKFLDGLDSALREELLSPLVETPPELQARLEAPAFLALTPKAKLQAIEEMVREWGWYAYDPTEVLEAKRGKSIDEKLHRAQARIEALRAKDSSIPISKGMAGVCADFAPLTVALLREAGIPAGLLLGVNIHGKEGRGKDYHAAAFVPWPDGEGGQRIVKVDGTPPLGGSVSQEKLPNSPQRDTPIQSSPEKIANSAPPSQDPEELRQTLQILLRDRVKISDLRVLRRALEAYWYAGLDRAPDLALDGPIAEFLREEIRRERASLGSEKLEPPAGALFYSTIQEYLAKLGGASDKASRQAALEKLERVGEAVAPAISEVTRRALIYSIAALRTD